MATRGLETLPFIGESEVACLLEWGPLIDAIEGAMIEFSAGEVAQPVRQIISVPGRDAFFAAMPAAGSAIAVKIVTLFHDNVGTDIPTHQGVILVLDKDNGSPLALMDGRLVTEMRTAAGSAAAVRKLSTDKPDIVTIMGSGVQARAHVEALACVCSWNELRIWARSAERGRALADEVDGVFIADPEEAVHDADIVVCATAAKEPILKGAWLKPGAFVTAVGWNSADARELDDDVMAHTVIVESVDAARDQAGNVRGSGCEIFAEIGEIYAGQKSVPEGVTVVYDSVGMAIMDVAAAKLVYDLWLEAGREAGPPSETLEQKPG